MKPIKTTKIVENENPKEKNKIVTKEENHEYVSARKESYGQKMIDVMGIVMQE